MTKEKPKKIDKNQRLLEAARLGQLQQLELLLNQFHQLKSRKKTNPLASLRKRAKAWMMIGCLRKSVSPNNVRDPVTGFTCLHHAALNGHVECVQLILNYNAKLNAVDYKGSSALHLAAWAGNLEIVRLLLKHQRPQLAPSWSQASTGNEQMPTTNDLDINLCNNDNQTPLSLAAQFGHNAVVSELLQYGANVYIRNSHLESPLDLACLNGRLETVNLLLKSNPQLIAELRRPRSTVQMVEIVPQETTSGGRRESFDSPLHRFAIGSVSMRQKENSQHQTSTSNCSPRETWAREKRRATLSISGPLPALASLMNQTSGERLLDHSPIHYATRKSQANVLHLLLYQYNANLLQVTSLGSVLHEVALSCNQGRHADMLSIIFGYLSTSKASATKPESDDSAQVVNKLLSLKNASGKSVFDVLNEINNRTSQEIKRLIYQLKEQHLAITLSTNAQQQQQLYNSQVQKVSSQQKQQQQQQQFSDMQQFNSFVTMKRAPKQGHAPPMTSHPPTGPPAFDTQTIGRRRLPMNSSRLMDGYPELSLTENSIQQQPIEYQPPITRSVSNLANRNQQVQQQQRLFRLPDNWQQVQQGFQQHSSGAASPFENVPSRIQQQQQHFAQLVRSQTDCSHLMGRYFGDKQADQQQQQQQHLMNQRILDKKTINRHYHVYDHELYPPRILPTSAGSRQVNQAKHSLEQLGSNTQMVAVVAPINAPANGGLDSRLRASTRSNASESAAPAPPPANRLSLNSSALAQHQHSIKQPQMDRFIYRQANRQLAASRCASVDQNGHNAMYELRHPDSTGSRGYPTSQNQHQLLANSMSLESHLSEPHLFESTRQALMKDFDKLIGQELLNRNHSQIIDGRLSQLQHQQQERPTANPRGSQSTVLTSIQLDMDSFGERLTVSGTLSTRDSDSPNESTTKGASPSLSSPTAPGGQGAISPLSVTSQPTQTTNSPSQMVNYLPQAQVVEPQSDALNSNQQAPANQKPQPIARLRESKRSHPAIYDVPGVSTSEDSRSIESNKSTNSKANATARRISGSRVQKLTAQFSAQQQPPMVASQASESSASLTEPPRERPPPPPSQQKGLSKSSTDSVCQLGRPLEILATNDLLHSNKQPSSLGNSSSQSDESSTIHQDLTSNCSGSSVGGLLRMANSSIKFCQNIPSERGIANVLSSQRNLLVSEQDSGICTSNSPATSTSHDSEINCSLSNKLESNLNLNLNLNLDAALESASGPPSPRTAQLCIEEALEPLAKNKHKQINSSSRTVNKTTSPMASPNRTCEPKSSELFAIDRWLLESLSKSSGAHYENCRALQEQLPSGRGSIVEEHDDADDDDDYAGDSPEPLSRLTDEQKDSSGARSLSSGAASTEPIVPSERPAATLLQQPSLKNWREVLLKVVIDQGSCESETDGVFYIDPLELKNLANNSSNYPINNYPQTENAETLTDEELCAKIDKNSGFIKFVLRKRQQSSLERSSGSMLEKDSGDSCDKKRTKINKETEEPGHTKTLTAKDHQPLEVGRHCQVNEASKGFQENQKSEMSHNSSASMSHEMKLLLANSGELVELQPVHALRRWFSRNLAGLIDYLPNFIQNGFDDLEFLNHPQIINQENLKAIGITDENHRILIIDVVSSLPKTNFNSLISNLDLNLNLNVVELFHSIHLSDLLESTKTNTSDINQLKERYSHLPIGYKCRLFEALECLWKDEDDTMIDNNVVDMDTNSPARLTLTSSSSSKESIKSVVQRLQPVESEVPIKTKIEVETQIEEKKEETVESFRVSQPSHRPESDTKQVIAPTVPARPVAAVRRLNKPEVVGEQTVEQPQRPELPVFKRTNGLKSVCWPPKPRTKDSPNKENCKPIEANEKKTLIPSSTPPATNVSPTNQTKSTYQRLLEEARERERKQARESRQNSVCGCKPPLGPKPNPPAKPAKLSATKFALAK